MAIAANSVLTIGVALTGTVAQYAPVTAAGVAASAAGRAVGIAQTAGVSGQRVPVAALGTTIAIASAAIAVGALVEVASATQVVTKSAGVSIGVALTAAGAAGDQIEILLIPN